MERIPLDIERVHFLVTDLDALWVIARIQFAAHDEACSGRCGCDQFDHCFSADQRLAAPGLRDMAEQPMLSSRAGEFHPRALLEPYLKLSLHTAPDVRSLTCRNLQWAKRFGSQRTTRANHSRAPLGRRRRRLNLLRAQRIKKASTRRSVQASAD